MLACPIAQNMDLNSWSTRLETYLMDTGACKSCRLGHRAGHALTQATQLRSASSCTS